MLKQPGAANSCWGSSGRGASRSAPIPHQADRQVATPPAPFVATGYPLLFAPPADDDPDRVAKTAINEATTDLNCVIERAVATGQTGLMKTIDYVDVTKAFAEHGIVIPAPALTPALSFIALFLICDP